MLELLITPQFRKDVRRLPKHVLEVGDFVLFKLKNNPFDKSLNIKKLKNINPPVWRVRVGAYRIVYSISQKYVVCLRFRHRKDIYRNL